jgi:hypothetical protein
MKKLILLVSLLFVLIGCSQTDVLKKNDIEKTQATQVQQKTIQNTSDIELVFLNVIPEKIKERIEGQLKVEEALEIYFVEDNDTYVFLKPSKDQINKGMIVNIESISRKENQINITYTFVKENNKQKITLFLAQNKRRT